MKAFTNCKFNLFRAVDFQSSQGWWSNVLLYILYDALYEENISQIWSFTHFIQFISILYLLSLHFASDTGRMIALCYLKAITKRLLRITMNRFLEASWMWCQRYVVWSSRSRCVTSKQLTESNVFSKHIFSNKDISFMA